jgi:predicted metal-dependent phosphotriesterase family hydrolase
MAPADDAGHCEKSKQPKNYQPTLSAGSFRRLETTPVVASIAERTILRNTAAAERENGLVDRVRVSVGVDQFDGAFH